MHVSYRHALPRSSALATRHVDSSGVLPKDVKINWSGAESSSPMASSDGTADGPSSRLWRHVLSCLCHSVVYAAALCRASPVASRRHWRRLGGRWRLAGRAGPRRVPRPGAVTGDASRPSPAAIKFVWLRPAAARREGGSARRGGSQSAAAAPAPRRRRRLQSDQYCPRHPPDDIHRAACSTALLSGAAVEHKLVARLQPEVFDLALNL